MNLSLGLCGSFQRFHLRQHSFLFLGFRGISKSLIVVGLLFMQKNVGSMPLVGVVIWPLGELQMPLNYSLCIGSSDVQFNLRIKLQYETFKM